jgi:hypothetical protein
VALTFLQLFVGARQHLVVATSQHATANNQTYLWHDAGCCS